MFAELFAAEGSEIYLRAVQEYAAVGEPTTFAAVVAAARARSQTAIGLRLAQTAADPAAGYGVRLNPAKSAPYVPAPGDRVVVLAEH